MLGNDAPKTNEGGGYRVCAEERHVLLGEGEVVIGRSSYCSLVLDNETLSRVHASLRVVDDGIELVDMGSSNGTFVNGVAIKGPTRVRPGDDILLGKTKITIEVQTARISAATGRFPPVVRADDDSSDETTTAVARYKLEDLK